MRNDVHRFRCTGAAVEAAVELLYIVDTSLLTEDVLLLQRLIHIRSPNSDRDPLLNNIVSVLLYRLLSKHFIA